MPRLQDLENRYIYGYITKYGDFLMNTITKRKDIAIESLSVQFSQDKLSLEEYERLVDYINHAKTEHEMHIIESIIVGTDKPNPDCNMQSTKVTTHTKPLHTAVAESLEAFTVLSSRVTKCKMLKSQQSFFNILGNHTIIIDAHSLRAGRTVVDIVNIMGDTKVVIGDGISLLVAASSFIGTVSTAQELEGKNKRGQPELIITGLALCGTIDVSLRKEGED